MVCGWVQLGCMSIAVSKLHHILLPSHITFPNPVSSSPLSFPLPSLSLPPPSFLPPCPLPPLLPPPSPLPPTSLLPPFLLCSDAAVEADLAYMLQPSRIYIGDNINVFGRGKSLLRCWPMFHCHSIPQPVWQ